MNVVFHSRIYMKTCQSQVYNQGLKVDDLIQSCNRKYHKRGTRMTNTVTIASRSKNISL